MPVVVSSLNFPIPLKTDLAYLQADIFSFSKYSTASLTPTWFSGQLCMCMYVCVFHFVY